jgi:tetratricopeptide (TPR) repeat protein
LRPLIRAVSLATDDRIRGESAVALSSAYLLIDNSYASHAALVEARNAIAAGPWRHYGGLLEALCRLRASHDPSEMAKVHRALFESTLRTQHEPLPVAVGWLLLADALQILSLEGESVRWLEEASQQKLAPHVSQLIEQRLVDLYIRRGQLDLARKRLESQFEAADPNQANHAALQWSRLMLEGGDMDAGLDMCRQVLQRNPSESEKSAALIIMGEAYQAKRQFEQAALCFAGLLPP